MTVYSYYTVYQGKAGKHGGYAHLRALGTYLTEAEAKRAATELRSAARARHDTGQGRYFVRGSWERPR